MRRRAALLLTATGLFAGCASSRPVPPPSPVNREAAAGRICRYQAILDVRGRGEEGRRFSGELLVVFQRSDSDSSTIERLRLEALGRLGGSRWALVAEPGRVVAVVPSRRAFAEGDRLGAFTRSLLGVEASALDIAAMLSGTGTATPEYEVRYPPSEAWPPRELEVRSPRVAASLSVVELRVNARLHPDSFALRIPEDFRRTSLENLVSAR